MTFCFRSPAAGGESGAALRSLLFLLVLVLTGGVALELLFWGYAIKPGEMGVRRIGFGPGKGYQNVALMPGFHWGMPLLNYSTVNVLPSSVQMLHFNRESQAAGETLAPIEISTNDRAEILVDVSLFVRFYRSAGNTTLLANPVSSDNAEAYTVDHGGPADLLENLTTDPNTWRRRIRESASDALLRALKSVPSEQFYVPEVRDAKVREATREMNLELAKYGIAIEQVLLRRYTYREDQINQAIYRKNLQEQEERLNGKLVELEQEGKRLAELEAEYDAKIKTALVTGESDAVKIRSEADLAYQKLVAEGDLAVERAKASVKEAKASALSGVRGADTFLAMQTAPVLSSLRGGTVSDVDPFNLEEWARLLGASKRGGN